MGASIYLKNKLLSHILRGEAYNPPAVALALVTTPGDPGDSASFSEPDAGYERLVVGASAWGTPTDGVLRLGFKALFAPALSDWGTIYGVAITDSGDRGFGNVLFWAAVQPPKEIKIGESCGFDTHGLIVNIE